VSIRIGYFSITVDASMSEEVICPECGAINPPGSTWCNKDGSLLTKGDHGASPDTAKLQTGRRPGKVADEHTRFPDVRIHPPASRIELVDTRHGRVRLAVDNTAKFVRRVTLSASDADGRLQFDIQPRELLLKPNQRVIVELRLTTPPSEPGTVTHHTVTVVAEEGGRPVGTAAMVFDQRLSAATKRIAISRPTDTIRHGSTRRASVDPNALPTIAAESLGEQSTAAGTASASSLRTASMLPTSAAPPATVDPHVRHPIRLEPQSIRVDGLKATFLVVADNSSGRETLRVGLHQGDGDPSINYEFRPDTFEVPPAQVVASTLVVTAPCTRQSTVERTVSLRAVARNETVECSGTMVQSGSPRRWFAMHLLPVLGAAIAVLGVVSPLTRAVNYYWFDQADRGGPKGGGLWSSEPTLSQPAMRIVLAVLAIVMVSGLLFPRGLVTRVAAVLLLVAALGYGLYTVLAALPVDVGGMSYGFYLIVLGAVLGYVGGLLRGR
jgi:hypothetical protein